MRKLLLLAVIILISSTKLVLAQANTAKFLSGTVSFNDESKDYLLLTPRFDEARLFKVECGIEGSTVDNDGVSIVTARAVRSGSASNIRGTIASAHSVYIEAQQLALTANTSNVDGSDRISCLWELVDNTTNTLQHPVRKMSSGALSILADFVTNRFIKVEMDRENSSECRRQEVDLFFREEADDELKKIRNLNDKEQILNGGSSIIFEAAAAYFQIRAGTVASPNCFIFLTTSVSTRLDLEQNE